MTLESPRDDTDGGQGSQYYQKRCSQQLKYDKPPSVWWIGPPVGEVFAIEENNKDPNYSRDNVRVQTVISEHLVDFRGKLTHSGLFELLTSKEVYLEHVET